MARWTKVDDEWCVASTEMHDYGTEVVVTAKSGKETKRIITDVITKKNDEFIYHTIEPPKHGNPRDMYGWPHLDKDEAHDAFLNPIGIIYEDTF